MIHTLKLHIYYQDTDAGGIVYHSKYLDFAERARSELLFDMGLSNTKMIEQGVGIVVRQATLDFKRSARLDDLIEIKTTVCELKNASMTMEQTFWRDDELLVTVHLQLAFINPQTMRPIRITEDLKQLFLHYNKEN